MEREELETERRERRSSRLLKIWLPVKRRILRAENGADHKSELGRVGEL
jgi:hypothetical protein